jgi:hypothetical protein
MTNTWSDADVEQARKHIDAAHELSRETMERAVELSKERGIQDLGNVLRSVGSILQSAGFGMTWPRPPATAEIKGKGPPTARTTRRAKSDSASRRRSKGRSPKGK